MPLQFVGLPVKGQAEVYRLYQVILKTYRYIETEYITLSVL